MNVNTKALNIELTPAILQYLEKRLSHLEKIMGTDSSGLSAHVEIGKTTRHHQNGSWFQAQIELRALGEIHVARAEAESLYAAIDLLRDEITKELTREKDKRVTLARRGGRALKAILQRVWPF